MTRDEVIAELQSLARQSEDAARANDAGVAIHLAEYNRIESEYRITTNAIADRGRLDELYTYIVHWPKDARRLRREAATFRAAIELINPTTGDPQCVTP